MKRTVSACLVLLWSLRLAAEPALRARPWHGDNAVVPVLGHIDIYDHPRLEILSGVAGDVRDLDCILSLWSRDRLSVDLEANR